MHDGVNVLAYVHANPVNLSDPFGTSGVGEMLDNIMDFINNNRDIIADLLVDLMGPLEGVLDLLSAATGKDITGWLKGGCSAGGPAGMGWWDRACAAAAAAVKIAAGGLRLISKLKDILNKMSELVDRARAAIAAGGRKALCKLTGTCFVAGTLVLMENGALVRIEDVPLHAEVACATPPALPGQSSRRASGTVTERFSDHYAGAVIKLQVQRGACLTTIQGTPDHPFWSVNRHEWAPMGTLVPGDLLEASDGVAQVLHREVEFGSAMVFNMRVDAVHSYRVSPLGVLVHNGCVVNENGVKVMVYPNDHGPPHAHVLSGNRDTRIGQNGKPLKGEGELTRKERDVVERNRGAIRDAVGDAMRAHRNRGG
jgi:hypothetical protein